MRRLLLVSMLLCAGCDQLDQSWCGPSCEFSPLEWQRIQSLTGLQAPPPDPANKYVGNAAASLLGQKLFYDTRLSGNATGLDVLGRPVGIAARAPKGQPVNLACVSCHDPARGGSDHSSVPGQVSEGAGWYDVNANPVTNAAYYPLKYWNGRYDSLVWQILAVEESRVSMNGNRLRLTWLLHDLYLAEYQAVFSEYPFPELGHSFSEQAALLAPDGQCVLTSSSTPSCPSECRAITSTTTGTTSCWPHFPLEGKPGAKAGCQRGDPTEPFGDAYDCMEAADKDQVVRIYVNFAKAIAAYEFQLVSRPAPFDRWVAEGPKSSLISPAAIRGARLFVGKASCIECHNTALFSDGDFHNIGVPQVGPTVPTEADCVPMKACVAEGFHSGLQSLKSGTVFRIDGKYSDHPEDRSRQRYYDLAVTDDLKGRWRTPSLREIARTAPYMHTGVYATLTEVIEHYDRGGTREGSAPENLSPKIAPLQLTELERQDLVAFLETLTGDPLPAELTRSPELPK